MYTLSDVILIGISAFLLGMVIDSVGLILWMKTNHMIFFKVD